MAAVESSEENSTLALQCLALSQALVNQGSAFKFSISIGSAFSFSLDSNPMPKENKPVAISNVNMARRKVSPSTKRRNARRRDKLLKGKSSASPTDGPLVPPCASSSPLLPPSKSICSPTPSPLPPPSSSTSIAESASTSSVSPSPSPCPVHVHHFDLVSPTEETVKCDQCDQIFLSGHCLRFHTESFHMNIPPPQCQECGQGVHYYDCSNLNFPYLE